MTTQHTPGPWHLDNPRGRREYKVCTPVGNPIIGLGVPTAEGAVSYEANARLIAAAPDLLEALQSLYEHCAMIHKHWGDGCNQKQADAAIAAGRDAIRKATGEG